ncbi:hypothetical protein SARC_09272 [Sphaeroforma arctica JP610]|uniref:Uncharacterized protein n=1 Tax=Sphaeroforma arctica JP610 TaxID=667725 RepID=A0A0L0FNJ8_9EUKA|nr:hypothetical protein SARC_09272 [Sphaeroforma arctica JP610]KNC78294.1 hypothetical protein SARC_09272 [Sphaeroforma arctica JP610]|eukprot:XP_014152196.1 hypothetical protein SARC_09272 [Sphaeroforma arctica JP610]
MTLQGRMLPAMRADPDWLVAYAKLYAGVWPKFSKGEKLATMASFARFPINVPDRMYEVLQELIVFLCGRSMLKVLVNEVKEQGEHPEEPPASAADYMTAMQKRLAAYQAEVPVINLDVITLAPSTGVTSGVMAQVVSETSDEAVETSGPEKRGPKSAVEKRKELKRAARTARKLVASKQIDQRAAGLQSQHLSSLKAVGQRGAEIAKAASEPMLDFIAAEVEQFCTRYTNCKKQYHAILAMAEGKMERYLLSQCATVPNFLEKVLEEVEWQAEWVAELIEEIFRGGGGGGVVHSSSSPRKRMRRSSPNRLIRVCPRGIATPKVSSTGVLERSELRCMRSRKAASWCPVVRHHVRHHLGGDSR